MGYGGSSPQAIGEPWLSAGYYVPDAVNFRSPEEFDPVNNNPADPPRTVIRFVAGSPGDGSARTRRSSRQPDYLCVDERTEAGL